MTYVGQSQDSRPARRCKPHDKRTHPRLHTLTSRTNFSRQEISTSVRMRKGRVTDGTTHLSTHPSQDAPQGKKSNNPRKNSLFLPPVSDIVSGDVNFLWLTPRELSVITDAELLLKRPTDKNLQGAFSFLCNYGVGLLRVPPNHSIQQGS